MGIKGDDKSVKSKNANTFEELVTKGKVAANIAGWLT